LASEARPTSGDLAESPPVSADERFRLDNYLRAEVRPAPLKVIAIDLPEDGYLVCSLLPPPEVFRAGMEKLAEILEEAPVD